MSAARHPEDYDAEEREYREWQIELRRLNHDSTCIDCNGSKTQRRWIQHKDRLNECVDVSCETCNGTGEVDYRGPPIEYVIHNRNGVMVDGPYADRSEANKRAGFGLKVVARLVEQQENTQ